jgi:hypothetical protein
MAKSRLTTEPDIDWSRFDDIRNRSESKRPGPEWVTAAEYAKRYGITPKAAQKRLTRSPLYERCNPSGVQNMPSYYRAKPVCNS